MRMLTITTSALSAINGLLLINKLKEQPSDSRHAVRPTRHSPADQSDLRAVSGSGSRVPFAVPVLPVPEPEPCRRAKMSESAAAQRAAYGLSATSCCLANSEPSAAAARRSLLAASSSPAWRFEARSGSVLHGTQTRP